MRFYSHFNLLMVRSPGFGSMATNFIRPIQTRSRFGFGTEYLNLARYYNSPDRSTKSSSSHLNVLWVLVSTRFQVLFHSPPGVLFTFPSRYYSSIGHQVVFRLRWWSTCLPTAIPRVPRYSGSSSSPSRSHTRLSLSLAGLPMPFCPAPVSKCCPKPQTYCYAWFSLCRFRSPLLAVSRLISLPRPT